MRVAHGLQRGTAEVPVKTQRTQTRTDAPAQSSIQQPGGAELAPWGNSARASDLGMGAQEPRGPEAEHGSPDHLVLGGDLPVMVGVPPVEMTTGMVNALVDYVRSPEELMTMPSDDLLRGVELMEREPLSAEDQAELIELFPAYVELGQANDNHFSPPDPELCEPSGRDEPNLATEIDAGLRRAIELAAEGGRTGATELLNQAYVEVAWAGHFIADAYSAGHLFNKSDVRALVDEVVRHPLWTPALAVQLPSCADRIAVDGAETLEAWRHEVLDAGGFLVQTPVTALHLAALLEGALATQPELFGNGVSLAVHEELAAGVMVSDHERTWMMGGDHHLDPVSKGQAIASIEAAYDAVELAYGAPDRADAAASVAAVLARLPHPVESEQERIAGVIERATDVLGGGLSDAIALGAVAQLDVILEEANHSLPVGRFVRVGSEASASVEGVADASSAA